MAVVTNIDSFLDVVRKSNVLDDEKLNAFIERLSSIEPPLERPEQVAHHLYQEGLLSYFQSKQLLQGRWRRFYLGKKYKLIELIGQGGMGAVYLCEHTSLKRPVAVKVMPEEKVKAPGALERFQREARAIAQLDHNNIVRAFDLGCDSGVHFMVMEYVDGVNLERLISKHFPEKGLPLARALHYTISTALALQHAHDIGWIHRDIKPANILVDRQGNVKLLDLGLSRLFEGDTDQLTRIYDAGNVLGTADYIAPEQALDVSSADIRSDIYGLGCTLYFLLAGRAPFHKGSIPQKLVWHQTKYPDPIQTVRPDLPEAINNIIFKMIAKKPSDRYMQPYDVVEALLPFMTEEVPPPSDEEVPYPSPMVRQLLQTSSSRPSARPRSVSPLPYRINSTSDVMRMPYRAPSEVDTLKDVARCSSTTRKTSRTSATGRRITQTQLIALSVGVGLVTLMLTALVMWWLLL
ncbi:MAG: protein kinase [Planctomycetia bacterium]|nr:protein kinase [Planctomycetia bacterium]